jgi:hypothetical protein
MSGGGAEGGGGGDSLTIREAVYAPPDVPGAGRRKRPRLERVAFEHAGRRYSCRVAAGGRWEYEVEVLAPDGDPAEGQAGTGGWYRWRERWPDETPEEVAAGVVYDDRLRRDLAARAQGPAEGHFVGDSRVVIDAPGDGLARLRVGDRRRRAGARAARPAVPGLPGRARDVAALGLPAGLARALRPAARGTRLAQRTRRRAVGAAYQAMPLRTFTDSAGVT